MAELRFSQLYVQTDIRKFDIRTFSKYKKPFLDINFKLSFSPTIDIFAFKFIYLIRRFVV